MVRVLLREVAMALVVLAVLAGATIALMMTGGPPTWPSATALRHSDGQVIMTTIRLVAFGVLALGALMTVLRLAAGIIVMRRLHIPLVTHLAEAIHARDIIAVGAALRVILSLFSHETASAASHPQSPPVTQMQASQTMRDSAPQATEEQARRRPTRPVRMVRYTVQRGDSLSLIAQRLYGDAARYPRIVSANKGVAQPDGGRLLTPSAIRPGWQLCIPLPVRALSRRGDHLLYVVQPGDSESEIAARFLGDWKRYAEIDALNRGVPQPDGGRLQNSNLLQPGWVLRLPLDEVTTWVHRPLRLRAGIRPRPTRHITAPLARPVAESHQPRETKAESPQTAPSVTEHAALGAGTESKQPALIHHDDHAQRRPEARPPLARITGSDRSLPLTLLVALAGLGALVAGLRTTGRLRLPVRPLARSMQKAVRATGDGVSGVLAGRLERTHAGEQGNSLAHILHVMDQAGPEIGVTGSLARLVRHAVESTDDIRLTMDVPVRYVSTDALGRMATVLCPLLGPSLAVDQTTAADGTPRVTITIKRRDITGDPGGWGPGHERAHPVPLLLPIGDSPTGVVHVNLARSGPLLLVGGAQGSNTLVATLLAGGLLQASPSALRILIATSDDNMRDVLPALEHLDAPPATAGDIEAMAGLVDHAFGVMFDRFAARDEASVDHQVLLILDDVETLADDPRTLDRLGALCTNGHVAGIHILATTSDVARLQHDQILPSFPSRLIRRQGAQDSQILCGDGRATALDGRRALLQEAGEAEQALEIFTLTFPEVREVCAQLATVLASETGALTQLEPDEPPPPTPQELQEAPIDTVAEAVPVITEDRASDDAVVLSDGQTAAATADDTDIPVDISVLGGIVVTARGEPVRLEPKQRELLGALAVFGPKPVAIQRLHSTVFGDLDDDAGRRRVQDKMSSLRRQVRLAAGLPKDATLISFDSQGYWLDQHLVRVDYYEFQALLHDAKEVLPDEKIALLVRCVDLYAGDLCGDSEMDWMPPGLVQSCRFEYLDALDEIALYYKDTARDVVQAYRYARRRVDAEPDDRAYELLMQVYASAGDERALQAAYEEYQAALAALDVDEASYQEAEQVYRELRAHMSGADVDLPSTSRAG